MVAILTAHSQEAILQVTALEEVVEFLLNVARQALPLSFERGREGGVMLLDQLVEQRLFGPVTFVVWRWACRGVPCQ